MKRVRRSPSEAAYSTPGSATACEIDFLRGLGSHRVFVDIRSPHPELAGDPLELLKSYLLSMDKRTDWGEIDKDQVRDAALGLIAELAPPPYVPMNGHGLIGARRYAKFARGHKGDSE